MGEDETSESLTLLDTRRELTVDRVRVRILEGAVCETVPMSLYQLDVRVCRKLGG